MPTQREIAKSLGITQAAVSMALRGDRSISPEMRKQVCEAAEKSGYSINKHVSALMSNVRTGKKLTDKGIIGVLIDAPSQKDWHRLDFFRQFHRGILQRGQELGFRVETFYMQKPNLKNSRVDQILYARGIDGIILAPPGQGNRLPELQWERYAVIDAAVSWEDKDFNRVYSNQFQNYITVFNELLCRGYKRIGTVLGQTFVQGSRHKTQWHSGYLVCQHELPENDRIPLLALDRRPQGSAFCAEEDRVLFAEFQAWVNQWRPDVIVTLRGIEKRWIEAMNLKIPQDVGIACLTQQEDKRFAGIDEKPEITGATALEQVAAQIARNEFGLPAYPKVTLIDGQWKNGATAPNRPIRE